VVHGAGPVVRVFSHHAQDLLALASNAAAYAEATPDVAPLVPWPTPAEGFRLRNYPLAQFTQADSNMRIFRSTNLMLNVLTPRMVPRDVHKLSPHSHADFEQGSLALRGEWIHHMRYPWVPDMTAWRDDEHIEVGSPSLTVIPPKVVHTSRNLNEGGAWLLDIFAPPRMDFSSKPGKVANEKDYPLPTP
jgi:mannose-6-phosphate isomerase-like protein (cupin superfamily)